MLQLTAQSRIFLAVQPVDCRKGIDGLAALCRQVLHENPLGGTVYVFRNRTGTTLKLLMYDGQGFWSSRAQARAALGREFPPLTLSMVRRGPTPTMTHVSCAPSKIPDRGFSPVRLQAVVSCDHPPPSS